MMSLSLLRKSSQPSSTVSGPAGAYLSCLSSSMRRRSIGDMAESASAPAICSTRISESSIKRQAMYSRGSISDVVRAANEEVGQKVSCLTTSERQPNSKMDMPRRGRTMLPPIAVRGEDIVDDIHGLLRSASSVYDELLPRDKPAANRQASIPSHVQEVPYGTQVAPSKTRARPKRQPRSDGGMPQTTRSEAKMYVSKTLSDLRSDAELREQFAARVASYDRSPTDRPILKANVLAVAKAKPSEYLETIRMRSLKRIEREEQRRIEVLERKDEAEESRIAQVQAHSKRWADEHRDRLEREKKAALRQRQAAWLVILAEVLPAIRMGKELTNYRERKMLFAQKLEASKSFVMAWRIYLMKKRLKALTTVRILMRRRFFFYRMRRNILRKRQAVLTLIDYLSSLRQISKPQVLIRRYAHAVRKIQTGWRRKALVIHVHLDLMLKRWLVADRKRGLSMSAALSIETKEKQARIDVLRDDLRLRKAAHLVQMIGYRKVSSLCLLGFLHCSVACACYCARMRRAVRFPCVFSFACVCSLRIKLRHCSACS